MRKPKPKPKEKLCEGCDQPMLPPGVEKKPNEYDHAQGCPYEKCCSDCPPSGYPTNKTRCAECPVK